ncbi:MAG: tRNA pseudouridine(55) synthase TruB [Pyrinomonadaceae bacterium]
MFDGSLIIDKPEGWTSHDVVGKMRKILSTKRIGHTGTLDPFATGVLVILVGRATRLAQFLDKDKKSYEAEIAFGFETDTGDRTGNAKSKVQSARSVSVEELEKVLPEFRGEILQTPPMYSAKKIEGKKLYELARKGIEIERQAVNIKIYDLEILKNSQHPAPSTQHFALCVACSAGTYIRTLAEDIGRKLETGAHLAELRRTRAGKFDISQAVTLEQLEKIVLQNRLDEISISMNEAISHLPQILLNEEEIGKTRNGVKVKREILDANDGVNIRMIDENENLLAVGIFSEAEKTVQPKIVLM